MNELDKKIQEVLRKEDAEVMGRIESEPSVMEMILETFRGRYRWLAFIAVFWTFVFLGVGIYSAVRFFRAVETRDLLLWASATLICMLAVAMMKIWYWMELNKNALTREIKRLELQVAQLSSRLDG